MGVKLTREDGRKRIVVTGMNVISPFGTDVDEFYDNLLEGKSSISKVEEFNVEGWPTQFAGEIKKGTLDVKGYIQPKMVSRLDPFLTYTIVTGKKALEDAGLAIGSDAFNELDKMRCGTLLGSGIGGVVTFKDGIYKMLAKRKLSPFTIPFTITNMGSGLFAMDAGFLGPNYSISTACATGNYAINNAASHIMRGEADLMVAGGVEAAVNELGMAGFVACRAMSTRNDDPQGASRPWDKTRDGFVLGEGAGSLILETLEHALARGANIVCEYLGGAQSCDAYHMTDPRKDGMCVARCISNALQDSQVDKSDVQYINAHATSTPAGDLAEFKAVRSIFDGDVSNIRMNATKSLIGHGLGAAGGFEAVVLAKAIQTGKVHPTINVGDMEEEVDIDIVANTMQNHDVRVGMSNSFGFGGHNSTVLFGRYED
ncbi:hypothetical protein NDN08_002627 [Rhodosorus marinus]|uniref:3-oxoacyl-[acyl-carrier-protein] synthase n=1 Tax=Rhodosorus marinus TaxID=101924 RepID=A0AAV8UVQ2_9RHOD|nr:hypothetical protein NDN08_002627 [Rhodosorus marinus]